MKACRVSGYMCVFITQRACLQRVATNCTIGYKNSSLLPKNTSSRTIQPQLPLTSQRHTKAPSIQRYTTHTHPP